LRTKNLHKQEADVSYLQKWQGCSRLLEAVIEWWSLQPDWRCRSAELWCKCFPGSQQRASSMPERW